MSMISLGVTLSAHVALCVSPPLLRIAPEHQTSPWNHQSGRQNTPSSSPWVNSRLRRVLDFCIALIALVVLTPILVLCWMMIRLSSRGPALFRQYRMGKDGREFVLLKFRSMHIKVPGGKPSHTIVGDSRVTRVGAFLRRYKLDELPQFWNVLKGDMSLVGPRPKLAEHEALYMPYRPGVTGSATLVFRYEEHMLGELRENDVDEFYELVVKPVKARLDSEYMASATLASDLRVLLSTFQCCLNSSPDGRHELLDLVKRYAPEHLDLIRREKLITESVQLHAVPAAIPGTPGDLVSDLDDAA